MLMSSDVLDVSITNFYHTPREFLGWLRGAWPISGGAEAPSSHPLAPPLVGLSHTPIDENEIVTDTK